MDVNINNYGKKNNRVANKKNILKLFPDALLLMYIHI